MEKTLWNKNDYKREAYRGYIIDYTIIKNYIHVTIIHKSSYMHSYTGINSLSTFNHILPDSEICDFDGARKKAISIIDKHKPKKNKEEK